MVSIIVPVYILNDEIREQARRCLESIRLHSKDIEIIMVDNGDAKDLAELADIYIKNKTNVGYGPSVNQGFKLAHGEYLCAMNDDVEVRAGWLDELLNAFMDPLCGVVRPTDDKESGEGLAEDYTWYHGFCWIVKRELWRSMKDQDSNLLDEEYKIGNFEDLDLWMRILSRNLKLYKHYGVRVFHHGGLTIKQMNHSEQNALNEARFIDKHALPEWKEVFYP